MKGAVLALLMPGAALAQDLSVGLIDFDLLFQENAARVTLTTDHLGQPARQLTLPDGQQVLCSDSGCVGKGPNAGLGCSWEMLSAVRALVVACEVADTAETAALTGFHARMSAHVARNAWPPRDPAEVEARYLWLVEEFARFTKDERAAMCEEAVAEGGFVDASLAVLSDPAETAAMEAQLAQTGLPFTDPCH